MIPLVMSVIAKTETLQRDMAKAGQSVSKFSTTASRTTATVTKLGRSLMMMAGVGGGLYMLQRGLRGAVFEASRAEETIAKFNVVFGDNAEAASQWANEFGNSVGRATQDVQEWMAGVQDLFVPLGFARDKATLLSESLVKLAVDVASFSNKVDADVIRDFTSALVGNHETVRKYGIMISENAIKQEALNQGINKTYKELTDLEKVSLRMTLIQKGSTDAQGDAVRTADSFANQTKRASANVRELAVILAGPLTAAFASVLGVTNELADDLIKSLRPELAQLEKIIKLINEYENLKAARLRAYQYSEESGKRATPWDPSMLEQKPEVNPLALPDGSYYLPSEKLRQIAEREAELQKAAARARDAESLKRGAAESSYGPVMLEDVERDNEIALRRIEITADMYRGMKGRGEDYLNSQKALIDLQYDEYSEFVTDKSLLDKWYESEIEKITAGITEAEHREALSRAQITAQMYSDMGQYGDGYYQAQVALLVLQKADYAEHVTDKILLEEWYASELLKIQEDMRLKSLDAMGKYYEELRKDMEDSAHYISEQFASVASEIEGSMSSAFQGIIKDSDNWQESMKNFFNSIGDSFAKMVSDMIARWIMYRILTGLGFGNVSSNPVGGNDGGDPTILHTGWVPAGTPSFRSGRGLKSNEMAAIIEKDEMLVPNKQIVKSGRSELSQAAVTNNYYTEIKAMDSQSVQAALAKEKNFLSDLRVSSRNSNHPDRRLR